MTSLQLQIPKEERTVEETPSTFSEAHPLLYKIIEGGKLVFSTCIVIVLLVVVFVGIINNWCVLSLPPVALFILLLFGIILLAYVEALHYACVAVEKWDMSEFESTYPRAVKCANLVDTPDKVKKFLVGRQFFVIFVVFLIAQITSFPGMPLNFAGMPSIVTTLLVKTGLPGVALTLTFGQLISQIYVEEYTVQFLNLYGCEFIIRLSLTVEWLGVCHFSWLLYHISSFLFFNRCSCVSASKNSNNCAGDAAIATSGTSHTQQDMLEGPMSPTTKIRGPNYVHLSAIDTGKSLTLFDIFRYVWSSVVTLGAVGIIMYGISLHAYVLPTPVGATYIIFFLVLTLLFYLEGMMIAIVCTQYWDRETFKDVYPRAYALHEIINRPHNVKRFIIGRQFCTVLTGFVLAQITTFQGWQHGSVNKVLFFIVVQSGLVGVMTVLSFGQLMPELLAQEFPLRFMNLPGSYSIGRISLFFDGVAVGHCAWTVFFISRKLLCGRVERAVPEIRNKSSEVNTSGKSMSEA